MKRILFMIMTFLCCTYCVAQDKSLQWNEIVNYVACKYACAYIDAKNIPDYDMLKKDSNYVKFQKIKITDQCDITALKSLLDKGNAQSVTKNIVEKVIKQGESFENNIDSLLSLYRIDSTKTSCLKKCKEQLQFELKNLPKEEQTDVSTCDTNFNNTELEDDNGEIIVSINDYLFWILLLVVIGEGIVIAYLWRKKIPTDEHIKQVCKDSQRLEEKIQSLIEEKIRKDEEVNSSTSQTIFNLEQQIKALNDELQKYKKGQEKSLQSTNNPNPQLQQVRYARKWQDDMLKECTEDEAQYKLTLSKDRQTADFEYCGEDSFCIANKESIFDNVCDIRNNVSNAKSVKREKLGKLQLMNDGKWKVTNKAVVKFC